MTLPTSPPITTRQLAAHLSCPIKTVRRIIPVLESAFTTKVQPLTLGGRTVHGFSVQQAYLLIAIYHEAEQQPPRSDRYLMAAYKVRAAVSEGRLDPDLPPEV